MKQRSVIFLSATILALVVLWFFLWPQMQAIEAARQAADTIEEDIKLLKRAEEQIEGAVGFFSGLSEEEKELVNLAAPSFPDKVGLTILLDKIARDNGLVAQSISVSNPPTAGTAGVLGPVPATMSLSGDYSNFKSFLEALESTLRIYDVTLIDISSGEDSEQVNVKITGNAYYTQTSQ